LNHIEVQYKDWQVNQARQAIELYRLFLDGRHVQKRKPQPNYKNAWKAASDQMIRMLRLKHRSRQTEKTYLHYLRLFYKFTGPVNPKTLKDHDIREYLSYLAVERRIARSTQNTAFNAILFFYRYALEKEVGDIKDTVRAQRKLRLPTVLSQPEVTQLLDKIHGVPKLMAQIV
jgi:site-specific recombinase XerD